MLADRNLDEYVDRTQIANELTYSPGCAPGRLPVIDVTRAPSKRRRHHRPSAARP